MTTRNRVVPLALVWALALVSGLTHVLDPVHTLLLAACATAVTVVWPGPRALPPRLGDLPRHTHPGGRRDLSDLSWAAFERDGRVSDRVVARVRTLALATNLDPVVQAIDATRGPSPAQVTAWLDAIAARQGES
jgi:hypothetical protein